MKTNTRGQFVKVAVSERFWDKVDKNGPMHPTIPKLGPCWIWQGARTVPYGYGLIWDTDHRKRLRAHRVAWEITNERKVPKGKHLLHSCNNPPCVNPSHTYPGTDADNHKDMKKAGTNPAGERNPMAKLTANMVRDIRRNFPIRHCTGPRSTEDKKKIKALAKRHRISIKLLSRIAYGQRWKHI